MTAAPKTIAKNSLAVEAREMMEKNSIHQLLVVDFETPTRLVGLIHLDDLLRAKVI